MTRHRFLAPVAAALVVALSACAGPAAAPPTNGPAEVPDSASIGRGPASGASTATTLGYTAADETVRFQVALRLPGRADLDRYMVSIEDPASPDYGARLTPATFAARFGPSDAAVAAVKGWLSAGHLDVVGGDIGRTFLSVQGRAADIGALLGVRLVDKIDANQHRFHVPDGDPRIASSVSADVAGITGLDTTPRIHPMFVPPKFADVRDGGMLPDDAALAYDIKPLHDAGYNGEGQTVAIVSFDSFLDSDVAAFEQTVGLPSKKVERRAVPKSYDPVVGDGSDEVNLDIDIIRAIAPAATIINYETDPDAGFQDAFAAILDDGKADIVSVSWGGCEIDYSAAERALIDTQLDEAFTNGVTIFSASGDSGAFSCAHGRDVNDDRISALYPSSSPNAISVGGTFLWVRQDGTYLREAAWEETVGNAGSGGGSSAEYPRPDWQVATGLPNGRFRETPDVAGPGDGDSGMIFVHTSAGDTQPTVGETSGTSAATPFWAASMVLVRQLSEAKTGKPLGRLAPLLYQIAAAGGTPAPFHDVTLAGNLHDAAGPGWDAATGLGSPDVTALGDALVAAIQARP